MPQTLSSWPPAIAAARKAAEVKLREIADAVPSKLLPHGDAALVAFGSLARLEWTSGSDLDWALLIDGRADSQHLEIAQRLSGAFAENGLKTPGATGVFGGLTFSHDLVHDIGGDADTNQNMTRRVLLLLESRAIDVSDSAQVRDRVLRALLQRYVIEDAGFLSPEGGGESGIPRFLLNDVVRYWRTVAVDYAHKHRVRGAKGWALRNIKLRLSRKLLFFSGLTSCLAPALEPPSKDRKRAWMDSLFKSASRTPLENLSDFIERYSPSMRSAALAAYDGFLSLIEDQGKRRTLEELPPGEAYKDEVFLEARKLAQGFDESLRAVLFNGDERVRNAVQMYGVF